MDRTSRPRTFLRWLLFVGAFVGTAGFRYLTLGDGFPNDHFVYITGGWQMLFGEWPTRDWVDPGLPLMFAASAGAQALFGQSLFAEAVLVSVAFGLAASLTAAAALELTGSLSIALVAAVLEVVVFPRTYGYPKVLVYAAAFLCFVRFLGKPGVGRASAMAAVVVIGFLFRHDHGIFLGVGGALTILLAPQAGARKARSGQLAVFVAAGILLALPYLAYVQVYGGLESYVRAGIDFSQREAQRQWHVWPSVFGDPQPLASALVYEFYAIPAIALAVLAVLRNHAQFNLFAAQVVPIAVVAVMVNYNFIREPLGTRLPDAIVPALMLGAWLATRTMEATRVRLVGLPAMALALVLFAGSLAEAGSIVDNLDRADLIDEWRDVPRLLSERTASLHERFSVRQLPTGVTASLLPFFSYVDRCTQLEHRLLIGGYLVEVPFFAQRRFAAGQAYFGGSFGSAEGERRAIQRLPGQVVPFAVIPSDYAPDFESPDSVIGNYLRSRYADLSTVTVNDEQSVRILVDTSLSPTGTDAETGWPCFLLR